jgi:hypothetical protein
MYVKIGYTPVFGMLLGLIALDLLLRFTAIEGKALQKWQPPTEPSAAKHRATLSTSKAGSEPLDAEKGLPNDSLPAATAIIADARRDVLAPATSIQLPRCPAPTECRTPPSAPSPSLRTKHQRRCGLLRRRRLPAVLTLLASRRLLCALWGTLVVAALFSGLEATLTLQTAELFGWDAVGGGLVFLPLTIMSFAGPAVGWACDRWGPRWPTTAGFVLLCPALVLLRLVEHDSMRQKVLLYVLLAVVGACFTLTLNPLMAEIAYVVERKSGRSDNDASAFGNDSGGGGMDNNRDGAETPGTQPGGGDSSASAGGGRAQGGENKGGSVGDERSAGGERRGAGTHDANDDDATSNGGGGTGGTSGGQSKGGDRGAYAQAFALFNMAYSLGNAVGPLCAGLVRDAAGWPTMAWVLALFSAVSAVLACLWTGGWIGSRRDRRWQRPARPSSRHA